MNAAAPLWPQGLNEISVFTVLPRPLVEAARLPQVTRARKAAAKAIRKTVARRRSTGRQA